MPLLSVSARNWVRTSVGMVDGGEYRNVAVTPMVGYHAHVAVVGADLRVCPCATMVAPFAVDICQCATMVALFAVMFALQRNAAYCACRGEIWQTAWRMGRTTWQNRADTQVCPYENRRNAINSPKTPEIS